MLFLIAAAVAMAPPVAPLIHSPVITPVYAVPGQAPQPLPPSDLFERPVRPRLTNGAELLGEDDYPVTAMRYGQQGKVVAALVVSESGEPTSCRVKQSSGFPVLDEATCRLLLARARFVPARDSRGKAVQSAVLQPINWVLPAEPLWPVKEWTGRFALVVSAQGQLRSCTVEVAPPVETGVSECGKMNPESDIVPIFMRGNSERGDSTTVIETRFMSGDAIIPNLGEEKGEKLIMRHAIRFTILPDGKVTDCETIERVGRVEHGRNMCDKVFAGPYQPPMDASGQPTSQRAAIVMAIYQRQ
jgi:TonB family protein